MLDFRTQQHRLLPQVATAFALLIAGRNMMQFYFQVMADINKGSYSELPQVGSFQTPCSICRRVDAEGVGVYWNQHVCLSGLYLKGIFLNGQPFVTKLGMVMHNHDQEWQAKKLGY